MDHHINLISLQETKKESISNRMLNNLGSHLFAWFVLPSIGNSGGILVGINEDFLKYLIVGLTLSQ